MQDREPYRPDVAASGGPDPQFSPPSAADAGEAAKQSVASRSVAVTGRTPSSHLGVCAAENFHGKIFHQIHQYARNVAHFRDFPPKSAHCSRQYGVVSPPPASGSVLRRTLLAARGNSPAAFDRRVIPADGVARRSNTPNILPPRALSAGRLAGLGATRDFFHGLLDMARTTPSVSFSPFARSPKRFRFAASRFAASPAPLLRRPAKHAG